MAFSSTPFSRRSLIGAGLLAAAGGASARASVPQPGLVALAQGINPALVSRAMLALARHEAAVWSRDVVAIADFGMPSAMPRFHLIDLLGGAVTTLLVAHGKGSDPDHSGSLQSFSNEFGSNATSEGAYLMGDAYTGIHGLSRRLIGLDPSNAHAADRAIVIHAAWYADAAILAKQGRLGRSDGCFAFSERDIALVLARLGRGRLLYAGKG